MKTKIIREEKSITIEFSGRLDTPAAQETAPQLFPIQDEADKTIILDCTNLTYISSSGLRIFLILRKAAEAKGGKVIVKNINDDIRSVFMMTGFLNLFEIC
ncbi:MAG: STAS domain-containing protein [Bacteroidales bacterium]|jgi:anti-sigma B factor antagonist|nr:STAS domain-containing protein [Bacteroidales bacterium]MBQ1885733.1 STAS domain-containing protein [Bacteroidales bacterium]